MKHVLDVNWALFGILFLVAFAIIKTFLKEKRARKFDIDYAIGFVGETNTPEEAMRIRQKAREYMEQKGFHFDYTKAEAENQARRQLRMEAREELKQAYLERRVQPAVVVPKFEERPMVVQIEEYRERGVKTLYPRNNPKYTPPTPPRGKKRFRKRDGSTTYQIGLDVSPVHGVTNREQTDKTMQNSYKPFKEWHAELEIELAPYMEDDFPMNAEEAYENAMKAKEDARRERSKQEILNSTYGVREYKENLSAYDELRKKLVSKAV